jgi:hypothetical protein
VNVQVHVRSQHSMGSSCAKFGGPDTYVAVTVAPEGVTVPHTLRRDILARRGIRFIYIGEGYREHQGPRAALGIALARAHDIAARLREDENAVV